MQFALGAMLMGGPTHGQLNLLPDKEPQMFFNGNPGYVTAVWSNPLDHPVKLKLRPFLSQVATDVVAPVGGMSQKELEVLPGQTVIQKMLIKFPEVRGETAFVIQWQEDSGRVLGTTSVTVYPTNLLRALPVATAETNLGVLDPDDRLRPLLDSQNVPFVDLSEESWDKFAGKLVIIGPHRPGTNTLAKQVERMAKKGIAIVWFRPFREDFPQVLSVQIYPSAAIIEARPESIADLVAEPRSQLNLVRYCEMALEPKRLGFAEFGGQP